MSRDDKINKIESFLHILLLHLIKQHAEKRSTRSWEVSIKNAVDGVNRVNKRRTAGDRLGCQRYIELNPVRAGMV